MIRLLGLGETIEGTPQDAAVVERVLGTAQTDDVEPSKAPGHGGRRTLRLVTSAVRQSPEIAAQAQCILDMPATSVEANLAGQPPEVRERAHRLIDAIIEAQFDLGGKG